MKKIILLSGEIGSGKTTLAKEIESQLGFTRMSFADPPREMLKAIGLPRSSTRNRQLKDRKITEGPFRKHSPRDLLKSIAIKWGREEISEDLWAELAVDQAQKRLLNSPGVVFDDLRYLNEHALMLENFDWVLSIRLHRRKLPEKDLRNCSSEKAWENIPFDEHILNASSISDLVLKFKRIKLKYDDLWNMNSITA